MIISFDISACALIDPIVKVLRLVAERTDLIRNLQDDEYPPRYPESGCIVFGRDVSERLFQSILFLCREFGPESKSPLSFSFEFFLTPPELPYTKPPQW